MLSPQVVVVPEICRRGGLWGRIGFFLSLRKIVFSLKKRIRTQPWLQRRQNKVMMPNSFGQYATSNRETYLLFAYCSVPTDSGAAGWFEGSPWAHREH